MTKAEIAPGAGWLLAATFAQLRATTLWVKAQREARTVGEGSADYVARVQRRELCATLIADQAWRRAVESYVAGRCGDAEDRVRKYREAQLAARHEHTGKGQRS
jgi:uncharacterized protein YdbL (DUF1318 family)